MIYRLSSSNRLGGLAMLAMLLAVGACNTLEKKEDKWKIKGTWYYNAIDGGLVDSLTHYVEVYVLDDSTIQVQGEQIGTTIQQLYYIKNDTLFKCLGMSYPCMYQPVFQLKRSSGDTLWLSMNPKFTKRSTEIYWIRIAKDEIGPSGFQWTEANRDSLNFKMRVDYDRRKIKFYLGRDGHLDRYDSLVKAGMWSWTMKTRH